jgi:antitoxin ParD1/3/4
MRQVKTLNVSLTPALHALIARHVASGRYGSASEVVRAALRAFEHQEAKRPELEPPKTLRREK